MRWKRIVIVLTACVVVGIGVIAFWPGEREPEYNGKKLSEWLNVVATNLSIEDVTAFEEHHFAEIKSAASLEGIRAVRSIGTNAVPWFVKWVERDRPAWRTKAYRMYRRLPKHLRNDSVALWIAGDRGWYKSVAMLGFEILGPDAAPAVAELVRVVKESKSREAQSMALICLSLMGETARPALPYLKELASKVDQNKVRVSKREQMAQRLAQEAVIAMEKIEPGTMNYFRTNAPVKAVAPEVLTNGVKDF